MNKKYYVLFIALFTFVTILSCNVNAEENSIKFNWYGFVNLNAAYDQNPTSHGDFSMWVNPQSLEDDDPQFNMTHRATRFGMNLLKEATEQTNVKAVIEFDMYGNGGTDNKATLLLRHAYFTVNSGRVQLLAGQSWDLIAPLNPPVLNYPVMWGAGNIQYRRPQVSLYYDLVSTDETRVSFANGVFRTIGNDLTPTFSLALGETADGTDDGTDAAIPSYQSRLEVYHNFASGASLRLGASGLYGTLKSETNLGNSEDYTSYVVSGHFQLTFSSGSGLAGEYFSGSNLGSYFGGILNNSSIDGVESNGGWGSVWVKPSPKVKFVAGYSFDDVKDEDISIGNRSKNQVIFGNIQYSIVPSVTLGLEVSQWETEYQGAADPAQALRVESMFKMNF